MSGTTGKARYGGARFGAARRGMTGTAGPGGAGHGQAGHGETGHDGQGEDMTEQTRLVPLRWEDCEDEADSAALIARKSQPDAKGRGARSTTSPGRAG